jgi:hypothetical protein
MSSTHAVFAKVIDLSVPASVGIDRLFLQAGTAVGSLSP